MTFLTVVRNERENKAIPLFTRHGTLLGLLPPRTERVLETANPDTPYSPFSAVTYRDGGEVILTDNPAWPRPEGRWLVTLLNRDGGEIERRIVGHSEVLLLKGLPKVLSLPPDDDHAIHARMEIVSVMARVEGETSPMFPNYTLWRLQLRDVWTDRSAEELAELEAELAKLDEANENA